MSALDSLVIPADVEVQSVSEFPRELRDRFVDAGEGDFVVSRRGSRITSRIVDVDTVTLLKHFETPTSLARAVHAYATAADLDPRAVLEPAYALVKRLLADGLLAEEGSDRAEALMPLLRVGDEVDGWTVEDTIQVLDDGEVHRVRRSNGPMAVLKIGRGSSGRRVEHEADVLERLPPGCGPSLLERSEVDGQPALLAEWIDGVPILQAARRLHERGLAGRQELVALIFAVTEAYADLHDAGILHGDVHPGNLFVDELGRVRIIDFGASVLVGRTDVGRVGAAEYLDPQWARGQLEGNQTPVSPASEQYSLGALVYRAVTGSATHDFSVDRQRMLEQIASEPPRPFDAHHVVGWPRLEASLRRALEKDEAARFPSVRAMSSSVGDACRCDVAGLSASEDAAVLELEDRIMLLAEGHAAEGLPESLRPTASAAHGAASLAAVLLRLAELRSDARLLSLSELWAYRSRADVREPHGLQCADLDLDDDVTHPSSIHNGLAGVLMARLRVAHRSGDEGAFVNCVQGLIDISSAGSGSHDLSLGDPGLLLMAAEAYRMLDAFENSTSGDQLVESVGRLADALWTTGPEERLGTGTGRLVGMAHGDAGHLYGQILWRSVVGVPMPDDVAPRLHDLARLARATPTGLAWPIADDGTSRTMTGWCNGTAGLLHLWSLAAEVLGSEWTQWRDGAAASTADDPVGIGNLCCGLAGRVYALLHVHRSTGEQRWLEQARRLAAEAMIAPQLATHGLEVLRLQDRSLLKGLPGVLLCYLDAMAADGGGTMPLFVE